MIVVSGRKKIGEVLLNNLNKVFDETLKVLKQDKRVYVELAFVSEKVIQELNRDNRHIDKVTDVLSFPAQNIKPGDKIDFNYYKKMGEVDFETDRLLLGDVIICTKRVKEQAKEYGHTEDDEIVRLFVHSLLHLLGYDHIKDEDYLVMHPLELKILNNAGYNFSE